MSTPVGCRTSDDAVTVKATLPATRPMLTAPDRLILGVCLGAPSDSNSDEMFADLMLNSRSPQIGYGPALPTYDANAYPTEDFKLILYGGNENYRVSAGGNYLIDIGGDASLDNYHGTVSGKATDPATGRTTATLTVPPGLVTDAVDVSFDNSRRPDGSPGLAPVHVWRPIAADSPTPHAPGEFLSRNFAAAMRQLPPGPVRFMETLGTNGYFYPAPGATGGWPESRVLDFDERTPGYAPNQSGTYTGTVGVSIELVARVAAALGRDVWFNVPDVATDDYIRDAFLVLKNGSDDGVTPRQSYDPAARFPGLPPGTVVYLEWSNEVWNGTFGQYRRNNALAVTEAAAGSPIAYDGATDPTLLAVRRVAWKAVRMSQIAREVWGDAAMMTTIRPVLMGWDAANDYYLPGGLAFVADYFGPPAGFLWGAGAGGYRHWAVEDDSGGHTVAQIQAAGPRGDDNRTLARAALVRAYGLNPAIYEMALVLGGDIPTTFSYGFNQDPGVEPFARQYYSDLEAFGYKLACLFASSNGNYAQWISTEPADVAASPRVRAAAAFAAGPGSVGSGVPAFADSAANVPGQTYSGSQTVWYDLRDFATAGYLSVEVPGVQAAPGTPLQLWVDGAPAASSAVIGPGILDPNAANAAGYSTTLVAPISPGVHAAAVIAKGPVKVANQLPVRLSLVAGPTTRIVTEALAFATFQQSFASSAPPAAGDRGVEVAMTTAAHEAAAVYAHLAGFKVGFLFNTFVIRDAGDNTLSGVGLGFAGGGLTAGTFGAEIRGADVVGLIDGYEVCRAAGAAANAQAVPSGFEFISFSPYQPGTLVTGFRQYALSTAAPSPAAGAGAGMGRLIAAVRRRTF